jgi:hypothetical protein
MLRALVVLLLLANLGHWAWSHGWVPPVLLPPPPDGSQQREPARMAAQVKPESIVLVAAPEARRLSSAACLQAGPFGDDQWPAASAAAERAGLAASARQRLPAAEPASAAWLRVPEADPAQQAALQSLQDSALGDGFKPCP